MDQNFQQLDLQELIDVLAEETEKYTKAFISGKLEEVAHYKAIVNAVISEIEKRKQENLLPAGIKLESASGSISDATPTTID